MNGVPPSPKILVHFHEQLQLKLARGHGKVSTTVEDTFDAFSAARSATSLPTAAAVSAFVPPEISLSRQRHLLGHTRYVINDLRVDVFVRTENVQAWALSSTRDFVTYTTMSLLTCFVLSGFVITIFTSLI